MHYKNGRPAVAGDRIVNVTTGQAGILYDPNAQSTTCNGRLAAITNNDPWINLSDCLHLDDVKSASVPDTSQSPSSAHFHAVNGPRQ